MIDPPDPGSSGHRALVGACHGVIATVAMSVVLGAAAITGTLRPPPPRQITHQFLPRSSDRTVDVATVLAHTAYGAGAGAVYALITPSSRPRPGVGALYGAALWAAGYELWVPIARLLPPAHRDRLTRTLTMLAAHLVYGCVLGVLRRRA